MSVKLSETLKYETASSGFFSLDNFDSIEDGLPTSYIKSAILATCSLLAYGKHEGFFEDNSLDLTKDKAKSKALLSLSTGQIRDNIEISVIAVLRAFAFLAIRCGVYNAKKLHYTLMIQPIAFAFTQDEYWNDKEALDKIEYWYWSSLFSGAYVYDQSSVVIQDLNSLYKWLKSDDDNTFSIRADKIFENSDFSSKELLTMKSVDIPREGIRSAILQFILSTAPYDLSAEEVSKVKAFTKDEDTKDVFLLGNNAIHDHHLIPVDIRKQLGETSEIVRNNPSHILNSPLNRVLISGSANLKIGSLDPVRYFKYLGENGLYRTNILSSNHIPENFKEINTEACTDENILPVIEKRFELLKSAVKERLLNLTTD